MAWQTPKTNWQAGNVPAASDFNRIEGNVQELEDNKETPSDAQAKADTAEANAKSYAAGVAAAAETAANQYTDQEVGAVDQALNAHKADYTLQVPYAEATGVANTYAATLNPALTAYAAGVAVAVKINVNNTGASTINLNSLGAKSIKKPNGNDVAAGNLKAGSIYSMRYNGTNFILQGEGGEYGTATASDVLAGKTIGTETGLVTGSMPDRSGMHNAARAINASATRLYLYTNAGYYDNTHAVYYDDANFIPGNIKSGVTMFGKAGSLVPGATITVQRGVTNFYWNDTEKTVNISAVDVDKSIILVSPAISLNYIVDWGIGEFVSSTQIKLSRNDGSTDDTMPMYWQVISFSGNVTIQQGTFTPPGVVTISSVNLAKSFLLYNKWNRDVSGWLESATSVRFRGNSYKVKWYVITI